MLTFLLKISLFGYAEVTSRLVTRVISFKLSSRSSSSSFKRVTPSNWVTYGSLFLLIEETGDPESGKDSWSVQTSLNG